MMGDIRRPWTMARIRKVALEDAADRIRTVPFTAAAEIEMSVQIGVLDACPPCSGLHRWTCCQMPGRSSQRLGRRGQAGVKRRG